MSKMSTTDSSKSAAKKQSGSMDEDPCASCQVPLSTEDLCLQCERCELWVCLECTKYTLEEFRFMEDNVQIKWYCSEHCAESTTVTRRRSPAPKKQSGAVTNENLLEFMKTMNENMSKLTNTMGNMQAQIDEKTDMSTTNQMKTEMVDIKRRVEQLENTVKDPFPPLPPGAGLGSPLQNGARPATFHGAARVSRDEAVRDENEKSEHDGKKNNVVVFHVPESESIFKNEVKRHDLEIMKALCEQLDEFEPDEISDVKRLGRKLPDAKRPLIVTFREENSKAKLMTGLYQLREANEPFKSMRVQHDFTRAERENEKGLVAQMKESNANEKGNFFYVVKGLPGSRDVRKIEKRNGGSMRTDQSQGLPASQVLQEPPAV